jgi:DNA-binding NtrC family response regulator
MDQLQSILLIDDDPLTLGILKDLFTTLNVSRVSAFSNTTEAAQAMAAEPFSLIIVDYRLNGESGIEFLELLRNRGDQTPVIVLSGMPNTDGVVRAYNRPRTEFVGKPFQLTDLLTTVEKLLAAKA